MSAADDAQHAMQGSRPRRSLPPAVKHFVGEPLLPFLLLAGPVRRLRLLRPRLGATAASTAIRLTPDDVLQQYVFFQIAMVPHPEQEFAHA